MAVTSRSMGASQPESGKALPALYVIMVWQVLVGGGCLYVASQILQIERIFNLGNFVQIFLAGVFTLIAAASFFSAYRLYQINGTGRLLAMGIDFTGMVLALLYLGHITGLYLGLDTLADGLYRSLSWLWGIALGYMVLWLSWRFPEGNLIRKYGGYAGLGVMAACVVIILLTSGLLLNGISALVTNILRVDSIIVIVVAVIFGMASAYLLRKGDVFGETTSQRDTWQGWLFLMPNFVSFVLFFAGPLLLSFYLSFTDYNPAQQNPAQFVGLSNYTQMLSLSIGTLQNSEQRGAEVIAEGHAELTRFTIGDSTIVIGARDTLFWYSLFNTFNYCLFLLVFSIPPALGLAMLLNSKMPGMKFFRAVFFIPSIAAVVGVALIWQWLYDPTIGYINYAILQVVNFINGLFGSQIADPAVKWLTDERILMLSVVIMAAWQVIGFNSVIFLAGLQGVPRELVEAATVDGANRWTRFRKIILPLLGPTTFFVTITTLIAGLQAFAEPFSLIGENNPSTAKLTSVYYLYNLGFSNFRMGYASAVAWVVFIAIFIVTILQFRFSSSNRAYSD
jgi:ABC-type sugar transport system permease subunit